MFGSKLHGIATMALALAIMTGAVLSAQPQGTEAVKPGMISMSGDAAASCKANSVKTMFGFLGCNPEVTGLAGKNDIVRIVGGSRFVAFRG